MPALSCDLIRASDWRALYVARVTRALYTFGQTPSLRVRERGLGTRLYSVCVHIPFPFIAYYTHDDLCRKIRDYIQPFGKGCRIIRRAECLEEIRYCEIGRIHTQGFCIKPDYWGGGGGGGGGASGPPGPLDSYSTVP